MQKHHSPGSCVLKERAYAPDTLSGKIARFVYEPGLIALPRKQLSGVLKDASKLKAEYHDDRTVTVTLQKELLKTYTTLMRVQKKTRRPAAFPRIRTPVESDP